MIYKPFIAVIFFFMFLVLTGCKTANKDNDQGTDRVTVIPDTVEPAHDNTIHQAAINGHLQEVIGFLEEGVDVDVKDPDGRTPLMYASYNGYTEIADELLNRGAEIDVRDNYGRTALMFASSGPYPETVKLLLDHRADPDIADAEEHFTALMYASAEGQQDVVEILLDYNADPALKDIDGDDAITFARNNGHEGVVNLLQSFLNMKD